MNLAGLSLRDLEYVVAVADEAHFGRAAERCAISQPTLSVQVRKLESALGMVLFERSNRRVLVTEPGQAVLRQARIVLAEAQRLLALASDRRGAPLSGRLVLAAIQTLGPYYFPLVLRSLREAFPLLSLALSEARTAEILDGLRDGRIDAALISLPIPASGLTVSPLFIEPFLLACPADHALARGRTLRARDIAGPDLLLLDEGNCLRDQAIAACGAVSPAGRHATSLETLRSMVAAGAGYTLLPVLAAPAGSDPSGLLVTRGFDADGPGRTIALVWRASDPRASGLSQLADFFRAHAPASTSPCREEASRSSEGGTTSRPTQAGQSDAVAASGVDPGSSSSRNGVEQAMLALGETANHGSENEPGIIAPPSPSKIPPPRLPPKPADEEPKDTSPGPTAPPEPNDAPDAPPLTPDRMLAGSTSRP